MQNRIHVNTYARHIDSLVRTGLSLTGIAAHLRLSVDELKTKMLDENSVKAADWRNLTLFICFHQINKEN